LLYLRARWYDPATGRLLTRDLLPGVPSVPASLNPYVYALNNPVLYTDPSGEFIIPLLVAAAIGGGFAAYSYFQAQPCATFPSALSDPAFQRAVGIGMLTGAVGGLMGGGVAILGAGAFYGGLSGGVISGAVGGGLAGGEGIQTFVRANGDTLFYNPSTNEFAVLSKENIIRTYFKPVEGLLYWLRQTGGR
jgi:hypothetical protein